MAVNVYPHQLSGFIENTEMKIQMVMSNNYIYFQAKCNDVDILFVTRRGSPKIFKSIASCKIFADTFFKGKEIKVKFIE